MKKIKNSKKVKFNFLRYILFNIVQICIVYILYLNIFVLIKSPFALDLLLTYYFILVHTVHKQVAYYLACCTSAQ